MPDRFKLEISDKIEPLNQAVGMSIYGENTSYIVGVFETPYSIVVKPYS